jgi:hypothetical protein
MFIISVLSFATIEQYRHSSFESYTGHWFSRQNPQPSPNQDMRIYIPWPRNMTAVQSVNSVIYYMYPPFTRLPHDPFMASGCWLKSRKLMFLLYSPEPVIQIQTGLIDHIKLLAQNLSASTNFTHADFHSKILLLFSQPAISDHVVTFIFSRKCSKLNATCSINGTQMRRGDVISYKLEKYDFIAGQRRWRTLLGCCGFAVTLIFFALMHDATRWADFSPHSLALCSAGDYATYLLFYIHRESFDLGSSIGFGYLSFFALWIPFNALGSRFSRASRAYEMNGNTFQISWFLRWLAVAILLNGFTSWPKLTYWARFSYWIPQIAFSAARNTRKSVNMRFALLFSIGQLIFTAAMIEYHPIYDGTAVMFMVPVSIFVALQLAIVWLQNLRGGAFFLPQEMRVTQYDYRGEKPPEGTECAVCLSQIEENEAFLATPCHHFFHDACLRRWIDEQQNCPICRAPLPTLDIDPPDA